MASERSEEIAGATAAAEEPICRIRVWDLPTRLFHWLLVFAVTVCLVTGSMGATTMSLHMQSGLAVLGLLIFRLGWGFAGGRQSRFSAFVRGPQAVIGYAADMLRGTAPRSLGHNPLGGWSILAMLLALAVQAGTGLFASDDILTEGPLHHLVADNVAYQLTRIHRFNRIAVILLGATHILAVLAYLLAKGDNLITPMITGRKIWPCRAETSSGSLWKAAAIACLAAMVVWWLAS